MTRPAFYAVYGASDDLEWVRFVDHDPDWAERYPGGVASLGEGPPEVDGFCGR